MLEWWFVHCLVANSSENVESRLDQEGRCYTGVLCGLGWNPGTAAPVLPEHDMELAFDVRFGVEDVTEVRSPS